VTPLRLRVEPPDTVPFERVVARDRAFVGRAPNADIPLADALASRRHARLTWRSEAWWVEDLGARNPTLVNDREVSHATRLQPGDVLRIGRTTLHVLEETQAFTGDVLPPSSPPSEQARDQAHATASPLQFDGPAPDAHAARLQLLNDVHRALATAISLPDLLELILERCFAVLEPEQGVILLRDKDGALRPAASRRAPGDPDPVLISKRIVEEVADKRAPVLAFDTAADERFAGSESIESSGVRSVVAAPMADAAGTMGLIALYSRLRVRQFTQQDLDVLGSLASAAALRVRNVALAEEAAARRVLEHELALAHDIQMAMLPRQMPVHPAIEIAARLVPARSVGGDLYDVAYEDGRLWLIVADVAGKGVAAALYMAATRTLFRAIVPGATSLASVAARINRELCRDNERSMFVTALVAWLEPATGLVHLCDAGHNPPIVVRREGLVEQPRLSKGLAFGVDADFVYAEMTAGLDPGDMFVAHTDGITEARSGAGDTFDVHRLERSLVQRANEPVRTVVEGLVDDVKQFTAGAAQEDDLAVLALRYHGSGYRPD
jgi:serine phosphatase RsbU (regulator of sigma subunit)